MPIDMDEKSPILVEPGYHKCIRERWRFEKILIVLCIRNCDIVYSSYMWRIAQLLHTSDEPSRSRVERVFSYAPVVCLTPGFCLNTFGRRISCSFAVGDQPLSETSVILETILIRHVEVYRKSLTNRPLSLFDTTKYSVHLLLISCPLPAH